LGNAKHRSNKEVAGKYRDVFFKAKRAQHESLIVGHGATRLCPTYI
jgi:hypothetical protein